MKLETLKYIIGVDEKIFQNILDRIIYTDAEIGKIYLKDNEMLFNLSLYSYYPLLFKELFDFKTVWTELCLFSRYYSGWLLIMDKIYDNVSECNSKEILIMSTILSKAEQIISVIFQGKRDIYDRIKVFRNINDSTMLKEKYYFSYHGNYEDQELFNYCKDKYVLAKLIVFLCYYYDDNSIDDSLLEELYYSHDCYAIGRQILDEIEDVREDYNIGKFNIYAYKLIKQYGKVIDEENVKKELINTAYNYYAEAIRVIEDINDCGWKRFLNVSINRLEE